MKLIIEKKILGNTKKCHREYGCLKMNSDGYCKATGIQTLKNPVCFVDYSLNKSCKYVMNFGNGYICNCPVRNEIYRKYKI